MADEGKLCVCPQCGKKYKLKEGFEAKSFSCKGCAATVWVEGKPPAPAPTTKKTIEAPATRGGRGGHGRTAVGSSKGARRGRGRGDEGGEEGHGGRRHGREKKKNNTVLIAIGAVALIGIVIVVAVMASGKKEPQPVANQPGGAPGAGAGLAATGTGPGAGTAPGTAPGAVEPEKPPAAGTPEKPAPGGKPVEGEPAGNGAGTAPESVEGGEPKPEKGLSGEGKKLARKYDPPSTLGHLETTTPELRKQIDDLIAVMFDPQAGRDSQRAKEQLAAIGKPAFLPILGKMAAIRDTLRDPENREEMLIVSSLALADGCLRTMDGYLDGINKQPIRPGTDKKYVEGILYLHYKRWCETLKDMPEMPGAFDPSKLPPEEEEPAEKGKK